MAPDRWQRVQELFLAALELAGAERDAYLDRECAGDAALRAEVEALLGSGEHAESRISGAVAGVLELAGEEPERRERIGPYRVLHELGRGGMSTVYLAERADEQYRMRVAIKLIRRGLDTEDVLDRLRQERQILANLDHPHIARLLDGGTTDDGLPYVVMEHIEGEHIDRYCESRQLTVAERLRLFLKVAAAVQYAHRNLVIHRDIKPANILVTADGVPKLLDFGIAKLLEPEPGVPVDAPAVAPTAAGLRLLTPEFASPEQARGEPLTTATDVYSLGVLLYYLLSGRLPYRLESRRPREVEKTIRETEPARLEGPLAGDLDNIVRMALRKEPERRYASVEQLADDLRRHLEARPVLARPSTLSYRAGRFVRRHRAGVAAAALVAVAIVAGVTATVWQARIAVAERARAERNLERAEMQQERAERTSEFLIDLFAISDPYETLGDTITAREILDRGARKVAGELDDSELKAELSSTIGRVYWNLSVYDEALSHLERAQEIRRRRLGEEHPEAVHGLLALAALRNSRGEFTTGEELALEALERARRLHGEEHPDVAAAHHHLARALHGQGDVEGSESHFREALALRRRLLGEESPTTADTVDWLGQLLYDVQRLEEAEELFREALAVRRELFDETHPDVTNSLNNLGAVYDQRGDYAAAEKLFREALDLRVKVLGERHRDVAIVLNNLAAVLQARGDHDAAERMFRRALDLNRELWGDEHQEVAVSLNNLALALEGRGDLAGAEPLYREALAMKRRLLGDRHVDVTLSLYRLGRLLEARGREGEAETLYREAVATQREILPANDWRRAYPLLQLALLLDGDDALPHLDEGVAICRATFEQDDWTLAGAERESVLAACLTAMGLYAEAEPLALAVHERLAADGAGPAAREARERLAGLYAAWGRDEQAEIYRSPPP